MMCINYIKGIYTSLMSPPHSITKRLFIFSLGIITHRSMWKYKPRTIFSSKSESSTQHLEMFSMANCSIVSTEIISAFLAIFFFPDRLFQPQYAELNSQPKSILFLRLCCRDGVSTHYPFRGIWLKELILHPSAPQINFCSLSAIYCCVRKDSGVLCYHNSHCLTDYPPSSCFSMI